MQASHPQLSAFGSDVEEHSAVSWDGLRIGNLQSRIANRSGDGRGAFGDSRLQIGDALEFPMARYTLVYGVRLIPEGSMQGLDGATITLADGTTAGVTLHTFDGTIPQLRRSLDRSLDAFFDLLPGADDEDLDRFAD